MGVCDGADSRPEGEGEGVGGEDGRQRVGFRDEDLKSGDCAMEHAAWCAFALSNRRPGALMR